MTRRLLAVAVLVAAVAVAASHAAVESVACPAPKPLPAGVKKPPPGASATELANFLLALPQRKPCDVNLFTSKFFNGAVGIHPEGSAMQTAAGSTQSDAEVRAQLAAFMQSSRAKTSALALFDRVDVRAKVPLPALRAALAALSGTVAEPVIRDFLSRNHLVRFGSLPKAAFAAGVTGSEPRVITFNRRLETEHFALWSALFAHEVLHHDNVPASPTEEVILHAVNDIVHMQLLARRPELAATGTELSRQMNSDVLMLINSRAPGSSRSAIIAPGGKGTAPGSASSQRDLYGQASFFHFLGNPAKPDDNSPASPVFGIVLKKLLAPGVALPKPLSYSKRTAELFSKLNDRWLSPVDRLRISVLLGLVSVDEIVKYTGLAREKAMATFRLAPILVAMR